MTIRRLPQFKDEAEEARWWYEHRDEVAEDMVKAIREGRTGPGSVARLRAKLHAQEALQSDGCKQTPASSLSK
jgi:hypothetical protein